jgi:hypothetical protein
LKKPFLFLSAAQNQFGPVTLAARLLTTLLFFILHREAHHSAQSTRLFGLAQPTAPSFLSRPKNLTPAQLAYWPAQPTQPNSGPPGSSPSSGRAASPRCASDRCRCTMHCRWPPGRLPSPLINLAPYRLLSLLHSLKRPVLNFHHRHSVASSNPSPHHTDAIKGARSHDHFSRIVLPDLAPLIHAPSRPTPSTDTVFHSPPAPASFL